MLGIDLLSPSKGLSSALRDLTSVFGMGTGVTLSLRYRAFYTRSEIIPDKPVHMLENETV